MAALRGHRMRAAFVVLPLATTVGAVSWAHDFWLVPNAFHVRQSGAVEVLGQTIAGKSLRLRHRPRRSGQYVVAVSLKPRSTRESVPNFLRYLELEGAPEARRRLETDGTVARRDSVTRRYGKYAKAAPR